MVLIRLILMTMTKKEASFRPLAGIMVLITFVEVHKRLRVNQGFRPLAGIMVLIQSLERKVELYL